MRRFLAGVHAALVRWTSPCPYGPDGCRHCAQPPALQLDPLDVEAALEILDAEESWVRYVPGPTSRPEDPQVIRMVRVTRTGGGSR